MLTHKRAQQLGFGLGVLKEKVSLHVSLLEKERKLQLEFMSRITGKRLIKSAGSQAPAD